MALDLEAVQAALYARLVAQVTSLKFTSRRFLDYDAPALQDRQPAMLVVAEHGSGHRQLAERTVWTMRATVIFYARTPNDKTQTVETALFGLMKQVDAALQRQAVEISPDDDPGTTLAGLVHRCFRSDYMIHHGAEAGQGIATMTIEMVAQE